MEAYVEYSLQNRFFLNFPLWPVRHFENSQQRACALRGVSEKNKFSSRWGKSLTKQN